MKDLQVSLYEFLGFAAPGAIAFVGLYLVSWRLLLADHQDWSSLTSGGWAAILALSYLLGHVMQALSNVLMRYVRTASDASIVAGIQASSPEVIESANKKATAVVLELSRDVTLPLGTLYEVADNALQQRGKTESREVYVYREGFYRGMTMAFLLLAASAAVRMTGNAGSLSVFGIAVPVAPTSLAATGVVSLGIAVLTFMRFQRFAAYRVRNSIYGFLAIAKTSKEKE